VPAKKTVKKPRVEGSDGELRIIGGEWRSRKLRFPAVGGVRPTPARTRETLFNWLSHHLAGARCLDLFAGSGALGLEALSRGAGTATLVDKTPALTKALSANLEALGAQCGRVVCCSVDDFLAKKPSSAYHIVFLDPPFRQGWVERLLPTLADQGWVREGSWVYVEHESDLVTPTPPENWQLHRQKTAGQVTYNLFRVAVGEPKDSDTDPMSMN
jgi:16S rRNA (guanine966-N2)-methyltransferase